MALPTALEVLNVLMPHKLPPAERLHQEVQLSQRASWRWRKPAATRWST